MIKALHPRISSASVSLMSATQKPKVVIVVGGGFAGLAAAKILQESKTVDVTLLEASSEIGGRARSVTLPDGQRGELGATWIHGSVGHPVYDLAVKYNLMDTKRTKGTNFWKGAQFVREAETSVLQGDEMELASHTISEFAHAVDRSEDSTAASVGEHLRSEYAQLAKGYKPGSREGEIVKDVWGWRELLQRGIDGFDTTDDGNPKGLAEYEDLPGSWPPITAGYQAVAQRMAEDLHDVRLNSRVAELDWQGDTVSVKCADGSEIQADYVIVTVSLGVLKECHATLFKPPLPDAKVAAIKRLGMGVVDKLFVTFKGLQKDTSRRYEFIWRADQQEAFTDQSGISAIDTCFHDPTQQDMKDQKDQPPWYKGVYSLRLGGAEFIQGIGDPNQDRAVLQSSTSESAEQADPRHVGGLEKTETCGQTGVSWIAGHHAVAMERADPKSLIQGVKSCFKAFPAVQLPDDFQVTRSRWALDTNTRGSYSYVAAQSSCEDVSILAEALQRKGDETGCNIIFFAGEATSLKHIGTTAGAYFSGVRAAQELQADILYRKSLLEALVANDQDKASPKCESRTHGL